MNEEQRKVLVVDDEQNVCEGVRDILEGSGYIVRMATSGQAAVELVTQEPIDVVLLDLIMPGMDGADTCAAIKQVRPDARVVAISGSPSGERLNRFFENGGVDVYLYKPFGREELLQGVEKILSGDYLKV